MTTAVPIRITPLQRSEVQEADRIMRVAFGTFLGLPDPMAFLGDRSFIAPRFGSPNVRGHAARLDGRLIGTNFATRWGSFGFLGPLTVLPEYWDKGVARQLLHATEKTFDRWGLNRTALFTFPHSAKHVGLYQKFGYWPTYLTALMVHTPNRAASPSRAGTLLSTLPRPEREQAVAACARITHRIDRGLDLTEEIRTTLKQRVGEVVLIYTRKTLDGFALCMNGPGSEGGEKTCYVKFAAARSGPGTGDRFSRLLEACDAFALSRGASIEGGVNLAREDAFRRMRAHGYQVRAQGIAMLRPHVAAHNRADAYVIDDWR
jgi:GNAT superfamily N-acetyltransferase